MQAEHMLISGDSGSGKTSLAREVFRERWPDGSPTLSIWVNHDGARFNRLRSKPNITEVGSRGAMERAVRENGGPAGLRLNYRTTDQIEGVRVAREFCHYVADFFGDNAPRMTVVVDEAQNALPEGVESDNPLKKMLHEDRDKGIRAVLATQDPQDLAYTPLKQAKRWVWVGSPSTFHKGFLQYFNLQDLELPDKPFHYAVIAPSLPPEIIALGETKEKYA